MQTFEIKNGGDLKNIEFYIDGIKLERVIAVSYSIDANIKSMPTIKIEMYADLKLNGKFDFTRHVLEA